MHLQSVDLYQFRSFPDGHFEFCPGVNVFFGPNASGKTNLLEAIHVLSNLRSFRSRNFRELIVWSKKNASVRGVIQDRGGNRKQLAVDIQPHGRIPLLNAKSCKQSKDFLQIMPSATFVPDDLSLVKGAPAFRRYFLDKSVFHFYPPYWALLTDYNRVLRQKNTLLRRLQQGHGRQGAEEACEVWNLQLQSLGTKIIVQRLLFLNSLKRQLAEVYARWLGDEETLDIQYKSGIDSDMKELQTIMNPLAGGNIDDLSAIVLEGYERALRRAMAREVRQGVCVVGPHRDDLDLRLRGRLLRAYGSQGQQRTAVLALIFAGVELYHERYAEYPLLLLDDVGSELDTQRHAKLFDYLQQGMQVFITSTHRLNLGEHELSFDLSTRKGPVQAGATDPF